MADIKDIKVPTMPPILMKKEREFPITERENLLRALSHEKPLWMPHIFESSQEAPNVGIGEVPPMGGGDFTDMFGTKYKYSEAQGSATPINKVLSEVVNWKSEVKWPDPDVMDVAGAAKTFERDDSLALQTRLFSACFEQLHFLEGFEQTLVDLIEEPEACREFFERSVDFFIDIFDRKYEYFKYDWVFYNDDWGTAHGPFFSEETLRATILEPTKRMIAHIKSKGVKVIFHNCGLMQSFVPILVDEIHVDALDIQPINDIKKIMTDWGDKVTVMLQGPDPFFFYDPDSTLEQFREKARYYVDTYGAQANPGAGAMMMINAPTQEKYDAFLDEVYAYSLEKYKGL